MLTIRRIKRWKVTGPRLIITPYSAFDGWQEELWIEDGVKACELIGTRSQRLSKLETCLQWPNGWFIVNKEANISLPEIADKKWSVVIADESRFMANPKTAQSKFYLNNFRDVTHRIILTGTADYNNKLDYYNQLQFLDKNILPYKNYWDFRNKAFNQSFYDFYMKKSHAIIFKERLAKYCYFLKRSDINVGRKKTYIKRVLSLPEKFVKTYKSLEDAYVLEYRNKTVDKSIYATRAHIWMMKLCGGFVEDNLRWLGKIKEVDYLLQHHLLEEQVVILCRHKTEINALLDYINNNKTLKRLKITAKAVHGNISIKNRRNNIKGFKNNEFSTLIAESSTIAHGVDLKNASCIIHYSQPRSEEVRDQVDDRIITLSDTNTVLIIDILVKNTVDYDTRIGHINHSNIREIFEQTIKRRQHAKTRNIK